MNKKVENLIVRILTAIMRWLIKIGAVDLKKIKGTSPGVTEQFRFTSSFSMGVVENGDVIKRISSK